MTPLVELHEPVNLSECWTLEPPLIGINNRDLHTFQVDLDHTIRLRREIPQIALLSAKAASALADALLAAAGVNAMLVGESLMRSPTSAKPSMHCWERPDDRSPDRRIACPGHRAVVDVFLAGVGTEQQTREGPWPSASSGW